MALFVLTSELIRSETMATLPLGAEAGKALDLTREMAQSAITSIDQARGPAADALQSVAASIHEASHHMPGGERVVRIVHNASHGMNSTAHYVRQNDLGQMASDVTRMVRRNPERSLLMALAVGVFVGMAMGSTND
jgi:hypothetical protein